MVRPKQLANRPLAGPFFLLALLVLASGCAGVTDANGGGTPASVPPILVGGPGAFALSGCAGFAITAPSQGVTGPADRPPGWPPASSGQPGIVAQALRCWRIATGPFERGPVHLVLEWHGDAEAPARCLEGQLGPPVTHVLTTVLVDDAEVAAWLRSERGMPAFAANFTQEDGAGTVLHDWTWQQGAHSASQVRVQDDQADAPEASEDRLFWTVGEGLGSLDVSWKGSGSMAERPAQGILQPPLLLARLPGGAFAGTGEWFPSLDAQGSFTSYLDPQCEGNPP